MKVILLENVSKLGSIGEIIDEKRICKKFSYIKSSICVKGKYKRSRKNQTRTKQKDQDKKKEARSIEDKIKNKRYEIAKLSTENKELYGSVKPTEISKILEEVEKVKSIINDTTFKRNQIYRQF